MTAVTNPGAGSGTARPALFTLPLVLFLAVVAMVVALALSTHSAPQDLRAAVQLLADGDLDGSERRSVLEQVVEQAVVASATGEQWAGLLAAVALGDRGAYEAARLRLGGDTSLRLPESEARELLHLGDPMLGNVLAALVAATAGERELALQKWSQVQAQARLTARPFALELATAALQRLAK